MSFKHIPFGTTKQFNTVVEVPIGSHNKYEYSEELDAITLDYVFSEQFHWPFNYGYIPHTRGGDGDHLDVFILTAYPLDVGTIAVVRPIGMIEVLDRGEKDDKILAVAINDHTHDKYQSVEDLSAQTIDEFRAFFKNMAIEKNKDLQIIAFHDKDRAIQELQKHQVDI